MLLLNFGVHESRWSLCVVATDTGASQRCDGKQRFWRRNAIVQHSRTKPSLLCPLVGPCWPFWVLFASVDADVIMFNGTNLAFAQNCRWSGLDAKLFGDGSEQLSTPTNPYQRKGFYPSTRNQQPEAEAGKAEKTDANGQAQLGLKKRSGFFQIDLICLSCFCSRNVNFLKTFVPVLFQNGAVGGRPAVRRRWDRQGRVYLDYIYIYILDYIILIIYNIYI